MKQWKRTQHSILLNLGDGLITATVFWALSGKGYEVRLNGETLNTLFDSEIAAQIAVEKQIKTKVEDIYNQFKEDR